MQNFYKGKTILLTGSTGFKGSWLALWLHSLGAKVIGYALDPHTQPNLFDSLRLNDKIVQIIGDITDIELLSKTIDTYKPEMVFHLAAQPIVRDSYKDPIYTIKTNAIGTTAVLEMIRIKECIKGAVLITTDKVYENKEWMRPYRENDRLGGFDPYSSSKAMSELVIDSYTKSFLLELNKKVAVVRAGNVIGGGDRSKDRLIPDIVRSIMQGEKLILRNPDAVRPRQYMLEALFGYLIIGTKLFENDKYLGAYNFGPDVTDTLKVINIVTKAIEILGKGEYEIKPETNGKMHEAGLLLLDNTKAKLLLGWTPKYNVQEVLKRTLNFYRAFYTNENIEKLALEEINQFM
ncbi:MAG: CDP-glucose 4,6-dehydratase [Candidatus Absconditabacteria bacterium]|nr:CDP-glucose 4,6-dehydratase [Candidatus Absconditabacteria bacterium]